MKRKSLVSLALVILAVAALPLLAPLVHDGSTQQSAIRAELAKRGHPYQSYVALIKENGKDPEYGERFNVIWHDFDNETGMTPTVFYVKKKEKEYYVVSAGTGP